MTSKKMKPASTEGRRYRILADDLSYPDQATLERLEAGEEIPHDERTMIRPGEGNVVDTVPAVSVEWLLAAGAIEEVE